MQSIADKMLQEVQAVVWAIGQGMPFWGIDTHPDEVGLPLMQLTRDYGQRINHRNMLRAIDNKPALLDSEKLQVATRLISEYLPTLCPVLLAEDRTPITLLLLEMLMRASQRPARSEEPIFPLLSEN